MRDPRAPEILAWLRTLPLRDRLVTMYAMSAVFPVIKNDRDWTRRIDAVVAELNPTQREHADIMIEAGCISRALKIPAKTGRAGRMSNNQTGQSTQPIYYDDGEFIHACKSTITDRGVRLVWTKCDRVVPDDQGFTVEGEPPAITCPECWAEIG
jgi:hypothetical protein